MRTSILWLTAVIAATPARAQVSLAPAASVGSSNQYVQVALILANPGAAAIDAFGFRLTYPTQLLAFESMWTPATLTQGWFVVSGVENSPGVVQVGGFHSTPTAGAGVLAYAVFRVNPNALGSGTIALSDFVDDLAGAATANGVFQAVVPAGAAGLVGRYYDNIDFTGALLARVDPGISFDWAAGSPDPSMGVNDFSVRWTGWVLPEFGQTYTFYTQTDDGVRLWVNNQQIVNRWVDQSVTEWSGTIALAAGVPVPITMEFYERGGSAVARLLWSSSSQPKQTVPASRLFAALCSAGGGDVDGDGLLGNNDVDCTFAIYLSEQRVLGGCDYPSWLCEVTSADVSCDGLVTPGDALAVDLRRAAGQFPLACFATPAGPASPHQIGIGQEIVDEGGTARLRVTILLQNAAGLDAFGARLAFPSAQLAFQRAERGYKTAGWYRVDAAPATGGGALLFGGFGPVEPTAPGAGDVCRLYFNFTGTPGLVSGLSLSALVDDFAGASVVETVTGASPAAAGHRLLQNHPNPFNPSTRIPYEVGVGVDRERVRIAVYDVRGALVRVLVDADLAPGAYAADWDGRSRAGSRVASGVYFCTMRAGAYTATRRLVLLK